ncbi:MAG: GGDEF domain-containing protein [Acidobacteriota bacterium]
MTAEPIYLEKVDSYLVDEFHKGLFELTCGLWADVLHGDWYCHLGFFKSLQSHYDQVVELRGKPSQLQSFLEYLNFSRRPGSQGALAKEFVQSWMPIWRQRIFFLNAVYLTLKNRVDEDQSLGLALSVIKQVLHQHVLTVFSFLETDYQTGMFASLCNRLEPVVETGEKVAVAVNNMSASLQRYGFALDEVNDWQKQRLLFKTYALQPRFNEAFKDWGTQRAHNGFHHEIERLLALYYLEGLTHKRGHSLDGLTGLPDRKSFDSEIQRWMIRFKTDQEPFVCGMVDLDEFKKVNDTYGHQTGDFVLKAAAEFLRVTFGLPDFVGRYGGEEFVILFANLKLCQADEKIADAISRLGALTFEYQEHPLPFTFSCGLAECLPSENVESLIDRADKNMYEAKRRGKNQGFSGVNVSDRSSRVQSTANQ